VKKRGEIRMDHDTWFSRWRSAKTFLGTCLSKLYRSGFQLSKKKKANGMLIFTLTSE
jgi:hypothetical protein